MNKNLLSNEYIQDMETGIRVLFESVKEANARVDALETDRENLKERVVKLTKENAMLIEIVKNLSSRPEQNPDTYKVPPVTWPNTNPPFTPFTPVSPNPAWPPNDWLEKNKFVD